MIARHTAKCKKQNFTQKGYTCLVDSDKRRWHQIHSTKKTNFNQWAIAAQEEGTKSKGARPSKE